LVKRSADITGNGAGADADADAEIGVSGLDDGRISVPVPVTLSCASFVLAGLNGSEAEIALQHFNGGLVPLSV
jgi:hypothetical protein